MRRLGGRQEEVQLLSPANEAVYRLLGFFKRLRAFEAMQDFIAIVHTRARFMLAQQCDCVCQAADNPPVSHIKFGVKAQLGWALPVHPPGIIDRSRAS